tara:strand:- start:8 stop:505 length:498 start_codon:yes stop_codon:yes gene_type:complete
MWAVLKFDKKNIHNLKKDFSDKLGNGLKFYMPKIQLKKFNKKHIILVDKLILGDYLFCFHQKFSKLSTLSTLKYAKGLKYILDDFLSSQNEIECFIKKCQENEDENGYVNPSFFDFENQKNYEFMSGPFSNLIINIISQNKLSINALIGNYRITVSKKDNLVRPV